MNTEQLMVMSGILHANEKLNKMKLKLDEHQLDYLTMIIEQNMEDCEIKVGNFGELYKERRMLEDLYSKLIVLTKIK